MRHDPRVQRTQGTLGERIAAGDPEARAEVSEDVVQELLSGPPAVVAAKVIAFDQARVPCTQCRGVGDHKMDCTHRYYMTK